MARERVTGRNTAKLQACYGAHRHTLSSVEGGPAIASVCPRWPEARCPQPAPIQPRSITLTPSSRPPFRHQPPNPPSNPPTPDFRPYPDIESSFRAPLAVTGCARDRLQHRLQNTPPITNGVYKRAMPPALIGSDPDPMRQQTHSHTHTALILASLNAWCSGMRLGGVAGRFRCHSAPLQQGGSLAPTTIFSLVLALLSHRLSKRQQFVD